VTWLAWAGKGLMLDIYRSTWKRLKGIPSRPNKSFNSLLLPLDPPGFQLPFPYSLRACNLVALVVLGFSSSTTLPQASSARKWKSNVGDITASYPPPPTITRRYTQTQDGRINACKNVLTFWNIYQRLPIYIYMYIWNSRASSDNSANLISFTSYSLRWFTHGAYSPSGD